MAYCGPRGIELDAFLRWSPRSQAAALEWSAYEGRRCKNCATHPEEWDEDRLAYHAHLTQCRGCQQQQRLTEDPETQKQGRGVYAVMAPGAAAVCRQCVPDDDE